MKPASERGEAAPHRLEWKCWAAIACLSSSASVAAVRFATPNTLDELGTELVIFLLIPACIIRLAGAVHRFAGIGLALFLPVLWLTAAGEPSDSMMLWSIPLLGGLLILAAVWLASRKHWNQVVLGASILIAVGSFLLAGTPPFPGGTSFLLVGVDGAEWKVIDPLVQSEKMPNLGRLLVGGHRARLRSLPSMYSPQVWSTIATGCPPSVHGIEAFDARQQDFKVGRIWDQLRREGRSYGLSGWYFTWPPPPDLGDSDFVIPSTIAPNDQTFPSQYRFFWQIWEREVPWREGNVSYVRAGLKCLRHGVRISTIRRGLFHLLWRRAGSRTDFDLAWRTRRLSAALQADIFAELICKRSPEFAAILFNQVDKTSHLYWRFFEPEVFDNVSAEDAASYREAIPNLYMEIDRCLGKILRAAPDDANIMIVSDHGFKAIKSTTSGQFCRIRTENLIEALGLQDVVFGANVDPYVYIKANAATRAKSERILSGLRTSLSSAHLSGEDSLLFRLGRDGHSLVIGIAPRGPIPMDAKILIDGEAYPFEHIIKASETATFSGVHDFEGVYLLAGPAASFALPADSLNVLDVAPTVAGILGLPISPAWTGQAALAMFRVSDLGIAEYPLPGEARRPTKDDDMELRRKLRAMGYLE